MALSESPAHPLVHTLARWRVPLGFALAAVVLWCAAPTAASLLYGAAVAGLGETFRLWAAGHLEKSREVTSSGPYKWTRHPLYVGSAIIGAGIAIASASAVVAAVVALYLVTTIGSAIRSEELFLRKRFGPAYEAYANGTREAGERRFSVARAMRNREWRAILGLTVGFLLLVVKWRAG